MQPRAFRASNAGIRGQQCHAGSLVLPVIARATLPRQAIIRNREGKMGAMSSRHIPAPHQQAGPLTGRLLAASGGNPWGEHQKGSVQHVSIIVTYKESANILHCPAGKHLSHLHCSSSLQRASIAWHTHPSYYPAARTELWALAATCWKHRGEARDFEELHKQHC